MKRARVFNPAIDAFLAKALRYTGNKCLLWPFSRIGGKYAGIKYQNQSVRVHDLVCEHFHGPKPPPTPEGKRYEVAHSCGNGHLGCVAGRHLRWATRRENIHDAIRHGTWSRGAVNGMAKLTEDDVRSIRASTAQAVQLASQFGIDPSTVAKIRLRKRWRWLS